ncbi:hypothetical protein PYW07_011926 [Mythimna separata]|uniref:PHD-type domain-containing protein n=1 Tax=Mythimna separata TaxID=271217 RepID=A0AAD8DKC6_MYTSE|nr:hypothetical protein PYW07_011926 [Mythimna separata]
MRQQCVGLLRRVRASLNTIITTLADWWDSPILGRWILLRFWVCHPAWKNLKDSFLDYSITEMWWNGTPGIEQTGRNTVQYSFMPTPPGHGQFPSPDDDGVFDPPDPPDPPEQPEISSEELKTFTPFPDITRPSYPFDVEDHTVVAASLSPLPPPLPPNWHINFPGLTPPPNFPSDYSKPASPAHEPAGSTWGPATSTPARAVPHVSWNPAEAYVRLWQEQLASHAAPASAPYDAVPKLPPIFDYDLTKNMSMDCRACGVMVPHGLFMKCSNKQCGKVYDIKCLGFMEDEFKSFSNQRILEWICPECVCSKPRRNDPDTPVRSTFQMKADETSAYVNTQRGSRSKTTADVSIVGCDSDGVLLIEFRQFRLQVLQRLDMQTEIIKHLQEVCNSTKSELEYLKANGRVFQEKISQKELLITQKQPDETEEAAAECSRSGPEVTHQLPTPTSFATVARSDYNDNKRKITTTRAASKSIEATKTASVSVPTVVSQTISQSVNSAHTVPEVELNSTEDKDDKNGWTTVRRNRGNRERNLKSKNVKRGENSELVEIQATEKKKHLHVWRLATETTVEKLTSHVKGVCGSKMNNVLNCSGRQLDLVLCSLCLCDGVRVCEADEPLVPVDAYHPPLTIALQLDVSKSRAPADLPTCRPPRPCLRIVRTKTRSNTETKIIKNGSVLSDFQCATEFANYFFSVYNEEPARLDVSEAVEAGGASSARVHVPQLSLAQKKRRTVTAFSDILIV